MKQYHIVVTVPVVAVTESIRHNHIASVPNVPVWGLNRLVLFRLVTRYSGSLNKKSFSGYCRLLIKRYLCGANLIHRHCKRVGHEIIEKHRQFYYGSVHIISVMCEVRSFDPFRTAFLYNSSNCEPQMNQPLKATATPVAVPVKVGIVSNWHNHTASMSNVPVWGLNGLALLRPVTRYSGSLNKKSFSSYCRLLIKRYLCGAQSTHRHCKRVGHGIIEKHRQFYYGSLHIIPVMCGLSDFEPFRTAFLYNSSNCSTRMNQPTKATATPVAVPVKVGIVSNWHNHTASMSNVPVWGLNGLALLRPVTRYSGSLNKKSFSGYCLLLIKRYLCGAISHIQVLQASRPIDNRKHKRFYYNPLYISMMYMGCRNFGLYRTAFFYLIHLTATSQMKHLSLTTATNPVAVPVKVGSFLAWRTIAEMFNTLPDEAGTSLKACSMPAVCLSLVFAYFLMLEGGAQ